MDRRTTIASRAGLLAAALLALSCTEAVGPDRSGPGLPSFATTAGSGITLDQLNGTLNESGNFFIKGFNNTNPHHGDAIVATFFWVGSTNTNIIDSVTDVLTMAGYPRVGNHYTLVEFVTAGGISMATYVATNVRNFPDASTATDSILAVHAIFSNSIAEGGMLISAWSGVSSVGAEALGPHSSASGSGATPTTADPGAIPVNAGALAFGVTMADRLVGLGTPTGFANVNESEDQKMKGDAEYFVQGAAAGTADPQWTWFFDQTPTPGNWLATVLTLNPAVTHLAFTVQPSTTLPFMPIKPAVQVTAEDDQGNPLPGFTGAVSIAIGHNGAMLIPGTLSGTRTVTAVNGVATFSDLSIDQVGNGYTLRVSAAGMAGAESAAFNVGPF